MPSDPGDIPDWMVIDAVRYAVGRMTYQVGVTCDWLVPAWERLSPGVRDAIRRDLEEAFRRDDVARAEARQCRPLGMDMDRSQWERVRALWARPTPGGMPSGNEG